MKRSLFVVATYFTFLVIAFFIQFYRIRIRIRIIKINFFVWLEWFVYSMQYCFKIYFLCNGFVSGYWLIWAIAMSLPQFRVNHFFSINISFYYKYIEKNTTKSVISLIFFYQGMNTFSNKKREIPQEKLPKMNKGFLLLNFE